MKIPLLVLAFISMAAVGGAQDDQPAPRERKLKTQVVAGSAASGEVESGGRKPGRQEFVIGAGPGKKAPAKPAPPSPAPAQTSKSFEKAKVLTSNSPSGPFVKDGTVCAAGQVYTRTTGLDRTKPPMGCASPFESNDCMDVKNHRKFEPNEWLDPFTIQTVVNGGEYPVGKYGMYLSFSKTDVKRVGFATLKACAAPAKTCRWDTREPVIGPCGGPGCSGNVPCTTSNQGATGQGGGGTWTCVCN